MPQHEKWHVRKPLCAIIQFHVLLLSINHFSQACNCYVCLIGGGFAKKKHWTLALSEISLTQVTLNHVFCSIYIYVISIPNMSLHDNTIYDIRPTMDVNRLFFYKKNIFPSHVVTFELDFKSHWWYIGFNLWNLSLTQQNGITSP